MSVSTHSKYLLKYVDIIVQHRQNLLSNSFFFFWELIIVINLLYIFYNFWEKQGRECPTNVLKYSGKLGPCEGRGPLLDQI